MVLRPPVSIRSVATATRFALSSAPAPLRARPVRSHLSASASCRRVSFHVRPQVHLAPLCRVDGGPEAATLVLPLPLYLAAYRARYAPTNVTSRRAASCRTLRLAWRYRARADRPSAPPPAVAHPLCCCCYSSISSIFVKPRCARILAPFYAIISHYVPRQLRLSTLLLTPPRFISPHCCVKVAPPLTCPNLRVALS